MCSSYLVENFCLVILRPRIFFENFSKKIDFKGVYLADLTYPFITFWLECVATTLKSHVKITTLKSHVKITR
jgi:hypothetical protein